MAKPGWLPVLALAWVACATPYSERYRAAHPGWEPDFPKLGPGLQETLASVLSPTAERQQLTQVQRLRIFDLGTRPWTEISSRDVESGAFAASGTGEYVVVVRIQCSWYTRRRMGFGDGVSWYYLRDHAVTAYEHQEFDAICRRVPRVRGVPRHSGLRETFPTLLDRETDPP